MSISEISIFVVIFFVCMGVLSLVPAFIELYRERTQSSLKETGRELNRFFINVKPTTIIAVTAGTGILIGIASGNWILAALLGLAGAFSPRIALILWKGIRSTKFNAQLMDALLLMSNSLKSGLDIAAGIEKVANEMKAPISEEFNLVMNAYRLGSPLETALMEMTKRINSRTLETFVYAITIQRDTGGNVIRIFDQIVQTIREEEKLQKKVKALTSQATTQIIFMACFPWVLAIIFFFAAPDLMQPAIQNTWGQLTVAFLLVWEMIGVVVTKKIASVTI